MANDLSQLLLSAHDGDDVAKAELIRLAYDDLRRLARAQMANQRLDHTLTATALVHEVSAKLLEQSNAPVRDQTKFLAFASKAMRNMLIDHARGKNRHKRGGGARAMLLEEAVVAAEEQPAELIALNESLELLTQSDPRRAQVVEMRYFGGLSIAETAEALEISPATVKRDWEVARLWLMKQLRDHDNDSVETE